ncbi:MAG TPA: RNA 3'-terminal phosphate cyclase [Burkholderiales bacterium]
MIELDGSQGEGGGQILRSALSLAMITGTPFRIARIRAGRAKPGLLRQHLAAVQAAAQVCHAQVTGDALNSATLEFAPGPLRGGDYEAAIGSAGSCTLVLQTLLPALLRADAPSSLKLSGGTHNPFAPPAHFLQRSFLPLLARMGARVEMEIARCGFYPAGGGELRVRIAPCPALAPLQLESRGPLLRLHAESLVAAVPAQVAKRELAALQRAFGLAEEAVAMRALPQDQGPGNVLLFIAEHEQVSEVVTAFGERGVSAEQVAARAAREMRGYLDSGAAVGEHLADQLLLPLALAGGGNFVTAAPSQHTLTNAQVIARFLPVEFSFEEMPGGLTRVSLPA